MAVLPDSEKVTGEPAIVRMSYIKWFEIVSVRQFQTHIEPVIKYITPEKWEMCLINPVRCCLNVF
jgi:hypothetical protein